MNAVSQLSSITGIELTSENDEYAWDRINGESKFKRVTLFTKQDSRAVPVKQLNGAIHGALSDVQPDAVAIPGWSDRGSLSALLWCLKNKKAAVVMSESNARDEIRRPWKEWIKQRVVRLFSSGLVGGVPQAEYLASLGMPKERILAGYDVVDNSFFSNQAEAARKNSSALRVRFQLPERYFITSNRFIPKKNIFRLLDAYAGYRKRTGDSGWDLVLMGDGPLKEEILRHCRSLGLSNSVHFPGFKQYADLPIYYGLAEAFIHASTAEQWGLVVNEAMASGLPVLISNHCGCAPDLVQEGINGWTFDPLNIEQLTGLMLRISSDDFDRASMAKASRDIVSNWSPDLFARNLVKVGEMGLEGALAAPRLIDSILLQGLIRR